MNDNISKEQEDKLIRLYTVEQRGLIYCSKMAFGNANVSLAKKILHAHNIHVRSQSEAAVISNKSRIKYTSKDVDFFKKETHDMAWLLGFLASDGTIGKRDNSVRIRLSIVDIEILHKIKNLLNLDENVKTYITANGFECCSLSWVCAQHKRDLAEYGIVPNKTFTLVPPEKLSDDYVIDYIRGYFDGDGSVNFIHSNGNKEYTALRWQICSATPQILEFFVDFLYDRYGIPKVNIQTQKRVHNLYSIQYSTNSTKKIYNILYENDSIFLQRKKDCYENALRQIAEYNASKRPDIKQNA